MILKERVAASLASQSYAATDQNIQRAYWRFAKLRGGICGNPATVANTLATYLIKNKLVISLI